MKSQTKYIFVSGGVMSAVGKGVTAASIALLLKKHGYSVFPIKCENNLNVDFGTINPIEHGDPFLCADGLEADIDLGNYERFLDQEMGYENFMTMGQLYQTVIQNEREMKYDGEDVEPIPHVVEEIIRRFKEVASKHTPDFIVIELGGTVGEYENNNGLYYEAARVLSSTEQVGHVHVTYVPVPPHIGEPKTKPAQFGIKALMSMGIMPNFLVIRSEKPIDSQRRYKFSLKFNIQPEDIISAENLENIYMVPQHIRNQRIDVRILDFFKLKQKNQINISFLNSYAKALLDGFKQEISIGIVGKYFATGDSALVDSYYALIESIHHAAIQNKIRVNLQFINSEKNVSQIDILLKNMNGVIVPIGWGSRGVEGKIKAIKYARRKNTPFLGLCYGMQLAAVEFARNVMGKKNAHTEEVAPNSKYKVIHSIPFNKKYQTIKGNGTSMRLGSYDCVLKKGTIAFQIYDKFNAWKDKTKHIVSERHRHRFEFNNKYRKEFEENGFIFSGTSPDDKFVEMIELPISTHPFFIATQSHPEYNSSPKNPHPIFLEFLLKCNSIKTK